MDDPMPYMCTVAGWCLRDVIAEEACDEPRLRLFWRFAYYLARIFICSPLKNALIYLLAQSDPKCEFGCFAMPKVDKSHYQIGSAFICKLWTITDQVCRRDGQAFHQRAWHAIKPLVTRSSPQNTCADSLVEPILHHTQCISVHSYISLLNMTRKESMHTVVQQTD